MYKIRQIKYSSNSISIQVYKIEERRRKIVRHIGTARNEQEKLNLLSIAQDFIDKASKQLILFHNDSSNKYFNVEQTKLIGVYYSFLHELISKIIIVIGFDKIKNNLLFDLVIIRMVDPASKLRSIDLIYEYFGIKHRRQNYYQFASLCHELKSKAEAISLRFANQHYGFHFDILFYDVTTLYFESFQEDELRKNGFSKDNKSQQPQILIALMVTREGFPISYEVFEGSVFEGHTIIPVLKKFIAKNKVKEFTVVADAAMLSVDNILDLKKNKINYIVGARLGNLSHELINQIDKKLAREDGKDIRLKTDNGYLICSFSSLRYRKDKHEVEKQIERAKFIVKNPSKNKKLKFTKSNGQKIELNQKLIDKTKKLLGIKGYYTDLEETKIDNKTIMSRYHELYKIEQAFRISKNDLQTRPIFHFKEEPIKLHVLICFMALVISKHTELQTKSSIRKFIHECKKVTDARLKNKITDHEIRIRSEISPVIQGYLKKLSLLT